MMWPYNSSKIVGVLLKYIFTPIAMKSKGHFQQRHQFCAKKTKKNQSLISVMLITTIIVVAFSSIFIASRMSDKWKNALRRQKKTRQRAQEIDIQLR